MTMNQRNNKRINKALETAITICLIVTIFIVLPAWTGYIETHYTMNCKVTNADDKIITVIDNTGNLWDFYGEGLSQGDAVKVTFFTNTTDNTREDDEIIKVIKMDK